MSTVGIVAEYNPFHNGHLHHLEKSREGTGADTVVAVMSGCWVQQGQPAALSKWARAEMAVRCGADLVLELPSPFVLSSAEGFAMGAVSLLEALGCVDFLSFGSEAGELPALQSATDAVLAVEGGLGDALAAGVSFPAARQRAVAEAFGEETAEILGSPNNILAVEYLKALQGLRSPIRPFTISRHGAGFHDEAVSGSYASATHIRRLLGREEPVEALMPAGAYEVLLRELGAGRGPCRRDALETALLSRLRMIREEELLLLPDVTEGLHRRILKAAETAVTLAELEAAIKSKRYAHSRIRRILLRALLNLPASLTRSGPQYLRVLGLSDRGRLLLRRAARTARLPILTKPAAVRRLGEKARALFEAESRATDLYSLLLPSPGPCKLDYTTSPFLGESALP